MKKTLFAIVVLMMFSFVVAEKYAIVKFKEDQINFHWQNLNAVKQVVNQSDLPHRQVIFIVQSIDSLQKDIQLNITIDSLGKK
jgi:hypothetical protein